jgi:hypothetical protein
VPLDIYKTVLDRINKNKNTTYTLKERKDPILTGYVINIGNEAAKFGISHYITEDMTNTEISTKLKKLEDLKKKNTTTNIDSQITEKQSLISNLKSSLQKEITSVTSLLFTILEYGYLSKIDNKIYFISNKEEKELITIETFFYMLSRIIEARDTKPADIVEQNQMWRIRTGQTTASKMVLMHLITGQTKKLSMVNETIGLVEQLWNGTKLDTTTSR